MYHKMNNTHVHGIVKKMWIGTFSASATCVCPEEAYVQVSSRTQDFQLCININTTNPWMQEKRRRIKTNTTSLNESRIEV